MISFEIRRFDGEDRIFVNNQLFDWGIDDDALKDIKKITDDVELSQVHENIKQYFLSCLESFVGKKMSIKQVLQAIEIGYVE